MQLMPFKLITIIFEPVLSSQIIHLCNKMGATGFTSSEVKGQGSGEKSSGEIPDLKMKIEIIINPSAATELMKALATTYFENYSLITYSSDVSVMRPEKFNSTTTE